MSAQRKVIPILDLLLIAFFNASDMFCSGQISVLETSG
jgi:hypothetical protein